MKEDEKEASNVLLASLASEPVLAPQVSFSPDSSPERESDSIMGGLGGLAGFPGPRAQEEGLGLTEGTFMNVMKAIDESEPASQPPRSRLDNSQVDGSTDACSRSSVVSVPASPCPIEDLKDLNKDKTEDLEPAADDARPPKGKRRRRGSDGPVENVILERMKHTKPKNKLMLIRHLQIWWLVCRRRVWSLPVTTPGSW